MRRLRVQSVRVSLARTGSAALLAAIFSAVAANGAAPALAQRSSPCDNRLKPLEGPLGYSERDAGQRTGARCEGLYERPIALGSLRPVSLVVAEVPVTSEPYRLSWPGAGAPRAVSISAIGFKPQLHYRMDARTSGFDFVWPTTVLNQVPLRAGEFGVVATRDTTLNGVEERIYLPITFEQGPAGASASSRATTLSNAYVLKVSSADDLRDLLVTVAGPLDGGRNQPKVIADRALGRPYYISSVPLQVPLQITGPPGIYRVLLVGKPVRGSADVTSTFYVQHGD